MDETGESLPKKEAALCVDAKNCVRRSGNLYGTGLLRLTIKEYGRKFLTREIRRKYTKKVRHRGDTLLWKKRYGNMSFARIDGACGASVGTSAAFPVALGNRA